MQTALSGGIGFLDWLGRASWQAAVLAGLVLTVQWLFRKRLTPAWRYRLWLLVVIRLVLPFPPTSLASVFNVARFTAEKRAPVTETRASPGEPSASPTRTEGPDFVARAIAPLLTSAPPAPISAESTLPHPAHAVSWSTVRALLPWVWAVGVLFIAVRIAWQNVSFRQRLRRDATPVAPSADEQFARCRSVLGVRQSVILCETSLVRSPALYGLLRPTLLLPRGLTSGFSPDELRYVFLHELAHVKRRDLAMNWLMALLQTLHWFNPCLWLAFTRMRLDRELACDALALSCARDEETTRYGETIIRVLEGIARGAAMPGLVGVLESRDQIRERIRMIAAFKRPGRWSAMAVLLLLGLGAVGLTDASPENPVEQQPNASTKELTPAEALDLRDPALDRKERRTGVTIGTDGRVEVHGRVMDDQDHPIEGATVWAREIGGSEHQRTRSDATGGFAFRGLKADTTQFSVAAKGREPDARRVKLRSDMEEIRFRLSAGSVIRARVQTAQGEPVPGVEVTLDVTQASWTHDFSRTTDGDGRFEWDSAPKEPMHFSFHADGYEWKLHHELRPDEENVVTLRPIRRVHGLVVDAESGAPMTTFRLRVGRVLSGIPPRFDPTSPAFRDYTDPTGGAFTVDLINEEDDALQAEADGYSNETRALRGSLEDVVLRLKPTSPLTGIILDAKGRPVAGATVAVSPMRPDIRFLTLVDGRLESGGQRAKVVVTDQTGRFAISSPPESGTLIASCEVGFAAVPLGEVRSSGIVAIRSHGRLEGVLRVGGKPVSGQQLWLSLHDASIRFTSVAYRPTTDADGRFTINMVPPGRVYLARMMEQAPGVWTRSHSTEVTIEPGRTTYLTLGDSAAVVRGRVRWETRLPSDRDVVISGALSTPLPTFPTELAPDKAPAYADSAEWQGRIRNRKCFVAKVEPDGAMVFDSIPPGSYTLLVTATEEGYRPWPAKVLAKCEMPVTVPADAGPTTTITLDDLVLNAVPKP